MMSASATVPRRVRVGSVSFVNAKPLIYGLEEDARIELGLEVPSGLLAGLQQGRFDVALLPVIDYQRMAGLKVVTAGGIGSDGETLTVRIFSRKPLGEVRQLACDTDSHTSVALARVVLAERYGVRPEFADFRREAAGGEDAVLLIGDKVVCEEPRGYELQLDLGAAWKGMTGLPFLFAAWMAREGVALGDLPQRLEAAKQEGRRHVDEIVTRHAVSRGWPAEVARRYLTQHMKYDVGPEYLEAMGLFHRLAARHGAIAGPPRGIEVYRAS